MGSAAEPYTEAALDTLSGAALASVIAGNNTSADQLAAQMLGSVIGTAIAQPAVKGITEYKKGQEELAAERKAQLQMEAPSPDLTTDQLTSYYNQNQDQYMTGGNTSSSAAANSTSQSSLNAGASAPTSTPTQLSAASNSGFWSGVKSGFWKAVDAVDDMDAATQAGISDSVGATNYGGKYGYSNLTLSEKLAYGSGVLLGDAGSVMTGGLIDEAAGRLATRGIGFFGGEVADVGLASTNNINLLRLNQQFSFTQASSLFNADGTLTDGAIGASRVITEGDDLGNQQLVQELSSRGNISDWGKYATGSTPSPAGNFQMRFYQNSVTGEVYYGADYKAVFDNQSMWSNQFKPNFDYEPPRFNF